MLLAENPARVQIWLYHTKWSQPLQKPQQHQIVNLRQALINTGAHLERDVSVADVEPWLDKLLAAMPASHAVLIRPYGSWSVLHRARRRGHHHGATISAGRYAGTRVRAAVQFLAWLDARDVALVEATQSDVEQWLEAGGNSRYRPHDFLRWAHSRDLCAQLAVPELGRLGLCEHTLPADER